MRINREETATGNRETGKNLRGGPICIAIPVMTRKWITIATGPRTEVREWPDMMKIVAVQG